MIFLIIASVFAGLLSNAEVVIGILAVMLPGLYWLYRKIKEMTKKELEEANHDSSLDKDIESIKESISSLSEKLIEHMDSEDVLSAKIIESANQLMDKIDNLAKSFSTSSIQMIKALMDSYPAPANLAAVYDDGRYDYLWANKAYLNLVDISMQEFQSPGTVFLTISHEERELIKAAWESVGQRRENYDGEFDMVKVKTQEPIGRYRVIGYYIGNPEGEPYYYLSLLTPADDD